MRKFMKNDGLNDYKGFQAAFSHTLEEIYCCAEHYYRRHCQKPMVFPEERIQYGTQNPQERHYKDCSCSRDATLFIHWLRLILILRIRK